MELNQICSLVSKAFLPRKIEKRKFGLTEATLCTPCHNTWRDITSAETVCNDSYQALGLLTAPNAPVGQYTYIPGQGSVTLGAAYTCNTTAVTQPAPVTRNYTYQYGRGVGFTINGDMYDQMCCGVKNLFGNADDVQPTAVWDDVTTAQLEKAGLKSIFNYIYGKNIFDAFRTNLETDIAAQLTAMGALFNPATGSFATPSFVHTNTAGTSYNTAVVSMIERILAEAGQCNTDCVQIWSGTGDPVKNFFRYFAQTCTGCLPGQVIPHNEYSVSEVGSILLKPRYQSSFLAPNAIYLALPDSFAVNFYYRYKKYYGQEENGTYYGTAFGLDLSCDEMSCPTAIETRMWKTGGCKNGNPLQPNVINIALDSSYGIRPYDAGIDTIVGPMTNFRRIVRIDLT